MSELRQETPVRVYANRLFALLCAVFFAACCVVGVLMYLDHTRPPLTTRPWMYEEPGRTLVSVSIVLFCGAVTLIYLYWVLTPWPMFELDTAGITYRIPPFRWNTVRWPDIASITADKQVHSWAQGGNTVLTVRIILKRAAVIAHGGKPEVKLAVAQRILSIPIEELARHIRRHHAVTLIGFSPRDSH